MLISWSKRFVFLANLKTASTSIEVALGSLAEIRLDRSEFGKHFNYKDVISRFDWVFHKLPFDDLFSFGVIRDPVEYMISLYNSHTDPIFDNSDLSTRNMSFRDFLDIWCYTHSYQTRSQGDMFTDKDGYIKVKYIIPFNKLDVYFQDMCSLAALPNVTLTHENRSAEVITINNISDSICEEIRQKYKSDLYIFTELSGRLLSGKEKIQML